MHARSTATQAVKNNIRSTELAADRSLILAQQKVVFINNNLLNYWIFYEFLLRFLETFGSYACTQIMNSEFR